MMNPNLFPPFISRHCPSPHVAANYFLAIIHPLIASHLLAAARNAIVASFIELLSGSRSGFDLNICCCRLIHHHRSSPCHCSSPRDTYQHRAAAFNELLRSCSGFDLKVSHRLSSPCCFVYHLTATGNIVTAISELLRFGAAFSITSTITSSLSLLLQCLYFGKFSKTRFCIGVITFDFQ
ncbi:uncharacterized protein DS421_18g609090 [Arachis hypogaea]|nr:uncharacterized protein DS421_18g609090 [Arachis hypogaea]